MLALERKRLILEILSEQKSVGIEDLSNKMGVSEMTVRRDLQNLENAGLLTRTYGGAVNVPSRYFAQPSFGDKEVVNHLEKRAIGIAAGKLIQEGETIGLGSGTTCFQVACHLNPDLNITVVTNAVNIGMELIKYPNIQLFVTGGVLIPKSFALIDPFVEDVFQRIHINKLFLGTTGISLESGITTQHLLEASFYKAMIAASQEVIIVADHCKLNLVTLAPILELERVTRLITDDHATLEYLEKIRQHGVEITIADSTEVNF
jgi:DeoR family transcriptional regulator, fructose operon transcriptional repressor